MAFSPIFLITFLCRSNQFQIPLMILISMFILNHAT